MRIKNILSGKSGIYGIINIIDNKVYVGRTIDMARRFSQYKYDFKNRHIGHLNDYLYNAMVKYGFDNFDFTPLEFCDNDKCIDLELEWILKLKSNDRKYGYNLRLDTAGGMQVSSETSKLISDNLKQQWASGTRDGHSQKLKDNWALDEDRKIWQSEQFRKCKTKYTYTISNESYFEDKIDYRRLKELGLANVISNFYRRNSNEVMCKGYKIKRELLETKNT